MESSLGVFLPVLIALGVLVLFAILGLGAYLVASALKRRANEAQAELTRDLAPGQVLKIERAANFFGLESAGAGQVRGNGVLVLTPRDLRFRMWTPAKRFDVPLARVVALETPRSHLGKSHGVPLLKVVFDTDRGERDALAWQVVGGPDVWMGAIEAARRAPG